MENVKKIIEEKKRILDDIQRNGYLEITEKAAEAMTESVQAVQQMRSISLEKLLEGL